MSVILFSFLNVVAVSQTFTVKNVGKTPQTFKLQHVPAGTALTVQAVCNYVKDLYASVTNAL